MKNVWNMKWMDNCSNRIRIMEELTVLGSLQLALLEVLINETKFKCHENLYDLKEMKKRRKLVDHQRALTRNVRLSNGRFENQRPN